jgi:hypothetical protein
VPVLVREYQGQRHNVTVAPERSWGVERDRWNRWVSLSIWVLPVTLFAQNITLAVRAQLEGRRPSVPRTYGEAPAFFWEGLASRDTRQGSPLVSSTCCLWKAVGFCLATRLQPELPCDAGASQPVVAGTRGGKRPPPSLRVPPLIR